MKKASVNISKIKLLRLMVFSVVLIGALSLRVEAADPIIFNKDINNTKQRPFIVDKEEYPFKSNWYEKDGASMHYIDEGEGIPIVLTHGNPDWSFLNRKLIKQLRGNARVIAYDLPGFGFSDTPEGFGFTPAEHAEWISSLIFDHLHLNKFIMVVQDWGGPTGLTVATKNPDSIYGVVISNTWAWRVPKGSQLEKFSLSAKQPEMQKLFYEQNYLAATIMPSIINDKSKNNKAITDAYANAFPTVESRKGPSVFPGHITDQGDWLEELENRLVTLKDKPVEFVFGMKDVLLANQETRDRWRSHFPKSKIQLLPEANHFTQEDDPESIVIALDRVIKQVEEIK